jgi:hypothetical protein
MGLWCRPKPCKAKALREIAAREEENHSAACGSPNQGADNNNFRKRPDMVPSSLILPSKNPALFAFPTFMILLHPPHDPAHR